MATEFRPVTANEPGGIRTHDLRIKSPLLYQLSYGLNTACNAESTATLVAKVPKARHRKALAAS